MGEYIKELPDVFSEFSEQRRQSFLTAMEYKKQGKPLVGAFCTYLPMELPLAAGASVVSLCSVSDETIPAAEQDLPRNLCPLIKASYGFAKTDKCPYFYFSDLVIGETTCDGKKKMYEFLSQFKPIHVMELPHTQSEQALQLWKSELYRLKAALEERFHTEITEEKLRAAVRLRNQVRRSMIEFYDTMQMDPPPMSGMDCYNVLNGAPFRFDLENLAKELTELSARLRERGSLPERKPRILLTGCPIGGVYKKVISALEQSAYVVAFENCGGAKATHELVDEDADDIYEALARRYLNIGCSCMTPNPNRMTLLRKMIEDYKIDGVVEVVLQTCLTYSVESGLIRQMVTKDLGVPYISIETDYSTADTAQLQTRLGAFTEML